MPRPTMRHRELHLDWRIPSPKLRQAGADALQCCLGGKPFTGRPGSGKQRLDLAQLLRNWNSMLIGRLCPNGSARTQHLAPSVVNRPSPLSTGIRELPKTRA